MAACLNSPQRKTLRVVGMQRRRLAFALLTVLCASFGITDPVLAQRQECASARQIDAFAVRDLHSQLIVAGLGCGQAAVYNSFVRAYRADLKKAGQSLINYFNGPGRNPRQLDVYVTRAANVAAMRHAENQRAFCARAAQLFEELTKPTAKPLVQVAHRTMLTSVEKPNVCPITSDAS